MVGRGILVRWLWLSDSSSPLTPGISHPPNSSNPPCCPPPLPALCCRLFADDPLAGKLLVADSCTTSGDTVLTVLTSPSPTGGVWTACVGNDGERAGGCAGLWPGSWCGAARREQLAAQGSVCHRTTHPPHSLPPAADGCGTYSGPFKLNMTVQARQYYFILVAPYHGTERPTFALKLGDPPAPSPPSPRPPSPRPPPPPRPPPSPKPPRPPPRPPPPRPPPPPPVPLGHWSGPVIIPKGPAGLPFTSQPVTVRSVGRGACSAEQWQCCCGSHGVACLAD